MTTKNTHHLFILIDGYEGICAPHSHCIGDQKKKNRKSSYCIHHVYMHPTWRLLSSNPKVSSKLSKLSQFPCLCIIPFCPIYWLCLQTRIPALDQKLSCLFHSLSLKAFLKSDYVSMGIYIKVRHYYRVHVMNKFTSLFQSRR